MSVPWNAIALRLFLAASAGTAIVAATVAVSRHSAARTAGIAVEADAPPETSATPTPIPAEVNVFRTTPNMLAIGPGSSARRPAHPRTMATFQSLRSYPGAPPRIPHGLTPSEVRNGGCNTCHERGGYSQRFGAYVPVTPHPEMAACLQCHVGDSRLMSIPLPGADPSARCSQCHSGGGAMRWTDAALDWQPAPWPTLPPTTRGMSPPVIPHTLELRSNCLACHGAPSAVDAIRTTHPDRANCRQCHVTSDPDAAPFARPARAVAGQRGRP